MQLAGSTYALLTAITWAIAVILFRRSGDAMPPVGLNGFKNVVGLALLIPTMLVTGTPWLEGSAGEFWALLASGVLGIGIADSLYFYGLNVLGPSRSAIIGCMYAPTIVLLSYIVLGERLQARDLAGGLLIVGGVLLAVFERPGRRLAKGLLVKGVAAELGSVTFMGVAIVAVKPILEQRDVIWSTGVRVSGGLVVLVLSALFHRGWRRATRIAFTPQPAWRVAIPGAVIGTYITLLLWIAGFKYAPASIASLLNQTTTFFIVILAALFLGESIDRRRAVALLLGVGGSLLVLL